jgi:hypothetical protein
MAVKELIEDNKLVLELDNGDLKKFQEVLGRWNFIDSQSLIRFVISLMLLTQRNILYIDINKLPEGRVPASHLLKIKDPNSNG